MGEHANRQVIVDALLSLVRNKTLRAVSLSGAWGVGKTHLVHEFARSNHPELHEAKLKFVYVSLFGLSSLGEVRSRIAANSLSKAQRILARIPLVAQVGLVDMSKVGEIARSVAEESLLENLFVVIDDLERAGDGLKPASVIGLISELTERYGCKCVLILNRAKLEPSISNHEEKVFDLTLSYQPAISEVVSYGLPREQDRRIATPVFESLGCANIRVAKRLSWILRSLGETTYKDAAQIWPTIVQQATVLAILKYDHGLDRAQLEKVVARTEDAKFLKELSKELDNEQEEDLPASITALLERVHYTDAGFGSCIVDLLEKGSLHHPELATALAQRAEVEIHVAQIAKLRGFFLEMKAGFGPTATEFSSQLKAFLREKLVRPDRFDLFNLCDLLVQIDPSEESKELVASRLEAVVGPVPPANREKHLKQFSHLWAAGVFERIPFQNTETVYSIAECFHVSAWEPESVAPMMAAMAKFTEHEWIDFLAGLRDDNAMILLRRLRTKLKQCEGVSPEILDKLRTRVGNALKEISARDPLFKAKIEDYADPDKKVGPF